MKLKLITLALSLLTYFSTQAQQEAHYTQYMYNMGIVNPGYMYNRPGMIQAGMLYRMQWVGVDGAPRTGNLFASIPLTDDLEIGVNYLNDQIGEYSATFNRNDFNVDVAYKIDLDEKLKLSFGVKTGFDSYSLNFSPEAIAVDPSIENRKDIAFRIGAGLFLFSDNYYVGLSAPSLNPSTLEGELNNTLHENSIHLFLIGGYVFNAGDNFKIKPSTIVKQTGGAPLTFDVSLNALYNDRFEFGVSYRYQDAFAFMMSVYATKSLRIGYAYDLNKGNIEDFNSGGSHEFLLTYDFDLSGLGKKYASPRFY